MRNVLTVAEHVGGNVRDLRRAAGITQADLAGAMSQIGLGWHRGLVADVETGTRSLAIEELVALAAYFELPVWTLATNPSRYPVDHEVGLGNQRIAFAAWRALWIERRDHTEPATSAMWKVIDAVVGRLHRPWARIWRKQSGEAAPAYQQAWKEITASRPFPGPTFVATKGGVGRGGVKPPWSQEVRINLQEGEPFVARDEVDREILEDLERQGLARRISRQQAYKLRRRKKGDS